MSKKTKLWLLIATSAIVIGCIIFGVVMTIMDWDFSKLSTVQYVTNEYMIDTDFENIRVDTGMTNVVFIPTKDGKTQVVCKELEKVKHSVTVENGKLVISAVDERAWFDRIGINFGSPRITVYLPQKEYASISVESVTGDVNCFVSASEIDLHTTTGDIFVENISAGALDLSVTTGTVTVVGTTCQNAVKVNVSTGRVNLTDVRCKSLTSEGSTGDVALENVIATEQIVIRRSTGDVKFHRCDAGELIRVESNTGDVKGSLLSGKIFTAKTDTGSVDVPDATEGGGACHISTRTGNIRITIVYE